MSRDRIYLLAATVVVAAVLILGFREIGSPAVQRATVADTKRIANLREISGEVYRLKRVPKSLSEIGTWTDPEKGTAYELYPDSASQYRLCASFNGQKTDSNDIFWNHGAGRKCFSLTVDVYR